MIRAAIREPARQVAPAGRHLSTYVAVMLVCMVCVEATNTVRLWSAPLSPRRFPFDYVSRGVWSAGAFVRDPADYTMDSAAPIKGATRMFEGDANIYRDYAPNRAALVYPPTTGVLMLPYGLISRKVGLAAATGILDITGRLCVLASILLSAALLPGIGRRWRYWLAAVIVLAAFYPVRWTLICVQVQSVITLLIVGAVVAYGRSHNVSAGVLVGLAACLKPQYGVLVLFGLARKQWRFAAAACATGLILFAASVAMVGLAPWEDYVFRIVPIHSAGFGYYPNQSINGLVHRWLGHPTDLVSPPESLVVRIATTLGGIAFIALAVWPRGTGRGPAVRQSLEVEPSNGQPGPNPSEAFLPRALDLGIAALASTMACPTVWDHHFAWCIVLFCLCLAAGRQAALSKRFLWVLTASYLLLGTYFLPFEGLPAGPASLLNSPGFAGAILLLGAAWYARAQLGHFTDACGPTSRGLHT